MAGDADTKAFTKNVFRLQRAIRRDSTKTPHARLVGLEILDLVDWNCGYAYPGQEHLAETLGIDTRTVRAAIATIVVDDPPTLLQQFGTRYFRRARLRKSHKYYPLMTPRRGAAIPEANAPVADQPHASVSGETPEANVPRPGTTPANDAETPEANVPRIPEANVPLSTLRYPLEEPLSAAPLESDALRVASEGGSIDGRVIAPSQCTFVEFWEATGQIGEWGPAWGLWSKLDQSALTAIGTLVLDGGEIDTGGAWAVTWLRARGWENATPKRRRTVQQVAAELITEFEDEGNVVVAHTPVPLLILKPYSEEWNREHARRIAESQSVKLMESWASEGKSFPVRLNDARRAS